MKSEERSLHFAGRLLRRSEAEKQMRRPAAVGMTGIAGDGKWTGVSAMSAGLCEDRGSWRGKICA
jgi:putative protein kinase ArgK-like GTPase of G3E family